jgi:hypothetical protein
MTSAAKSTWYPRLLLWRALMLRWIARLLVWIVKTFKL